VTDLDQLEALARAAVAHATTPDTRSLSAFAAACSPDVVLGLIAELRSARAGIERMAELGHQDATRMHELMAERDALISTRDNLKAVAIPHIEREYQLEAERDALKARCEELEAGLALWERRSEKAWDAYNIAMNASFTANRDCVASRAECERLRADVRWAAQTVHQAHHDGPLDECGKNTCRALLALASPSPAEEPADEVSKLRSRMVAQRDRFHQFLRTLPETDWGRAAEECRNEPGSCWCGTHVGSAFMELHPPEAEEPGQAKEPSDG
jgi:hypothetical protein